MTMLVDPMSTLPIPDDYDVAIENYELPPEDNNTPESKKDSGENEAEEEHEKEQVVSPKKRFGLSWIPFLRLLKIKKGKWPKILSN